MWATSARGGDAVSLRDAKEVEDPRAINHGRARALKIALQEFHIQRGWR